MENRPWFVVRVRRIFLDGPVYMGGEKLFEIISDYFAHALSSRLTSKIASKTNSPQAELELELIQTQMTQKPVLRAEVYARALRASQNRKENSV